MASMKALQAASPAAGPFRALVSICAAGGLGVAAILESVPTTEGDPR